MRNGILSTSYFFYYNIIKRRQQQEKHKTQNIGWNVKKNLILFLLFTENAFDWTFVCEYLELLYSKECYISLLSLKIFVSHFFSLLEFEIDDEVSRLFTRNCIFNFAFRSSRMHFSSFHMLSIKNFQFWFMACYKYFFIYLFIYGQSNFFLLPWKQKK